MRRFLLLLGLCLLLSGPAGWVEAHVAPPPESFDTPEHIVGSGETLSSIARRYGADVHTLMRINDLADPREIYVGQHLRISLDPMEPDTREWQEHSLGLGENVALLAGRSGVSVDAMARANRLLNPGALLTGQTVRMPAQGEGMGLAMAGADETWTTLAIRQGLSRWEMMRLNPEPVYAGALVRLPGVQTTEGLPYPIVSVKLTPQPVYQGKTAILEIETAGLSTCEITYLERTEACYQQDLTHSYALIGIPAMQEPGNYELGLRVTAADGEAVVSMPLVVTAGRFNFERIDLPSNLQDLLDPELVQRESTRLAELQGLRSAERYWPLPYPLPVQASVSSYFGSRRSYNGGPYNVYHGGIDLRAGTGVPVHSPTAGVVVLAEPLAVRGNAVMVDHGWGVLTGYWHLSRIDVQVGQEVSAGQVLGLVGNTGRSTGSHLHWEMWVNGTAVDPLQWTTNFCPLPEPVRLMQNTRVAQ